MSETGTPPWPGDHHDKHVAAAKLGWARRHRNADYDTAAEAKRAERETAKAANPKPEKPKPMSREEKKLTKRRAIMADILRLEDEAAESARRKEMFYGIYRAPMIRDKARARERELYKLDRDFYHGEYMTARMKRLERGNNT